MIDALFYDGHSARAHRVRLHVEHRQLVASGAITRRWPLAAVRWPETTRHGQRVIHLADGCSLEVADAAAFDRWRQAQGVAHDSWVVRAQQSWRGVLLACVLLVAALWAGYRWGVPAVARGIVALVPQEVDRSIGESALQGISQQWLKPSALPAARQQALRERFLAAARTLPGTPEVRVLFHAADKRLGPNAFALPGGTIVFTDELVQLLADSDDTLLGVFGHELGHVQHRHGMRALVQVALIGAATSVVIGDFSSLLAGVPALLGQLDYSRQAEREADHAALALLRTAHVSPQVMLPLFERLAAHRPAQRDLPLALSSHPADEERMAFFRNAAP